MSHDSGEEFDVNAQETQQEESEQKTQESGISSDCEMIMGITGCDAAQATQYLEMSGGDIDAAVSLYFEMGSAPPLPPISSITTNAHAGSLPVPPDGSSLSTDYLSSHHFDYNDDDDDDYHYEDHDSDQGSGNEDNDVTGLSASLRDQLNVRGNGINDDYDVVRKPDSVKKMSLLGRTERGRSDWVSIEGNAVSSNSAIDPTIDWLYPMQEDISCTGNIVEARHVARGEKKWLLVNIQSHTEFDSHCLNRDTWTDENIREIISTNFIFWQRGHTTIDASIYMSRYNVQEAGLPHVSILDPRSGLCMLTITGFRSPDLMSEILIEFLDKHDIESLNHSASPLSCSPQLNSLLHTRLTPQQQQNFSGSPPAGGTPETIFSRMHAAGGIGGIAMRDDLDVKFAHDGTNNDNNVDVPHPSSTSSSAAISDDSCHEFDPIALYGDIPEEPISCSADTTRVQIKLPKGRIVRIYKKTDVVKCLYAVCAQDPQVERKSFELLNTFPAISPLIDLEQSLEQANLLNAQVTLRYK